MTSRVLGLLRPEKQMEEEWGDACKCKRGKYHLGRIVPKLESVGTSKNAYHLAWSKFKLITGRKLLMLRRFGFCNSLSVEIK